MTRLMYDAITPSRIPNKRPAMVAGYVGGQWPSYAEMVTRFPYAVHVSIAVQADQDAQVLDVEQYDATPQQAVGWALRQTARGQIPTIYCNTSTWPAVMAAFTQAGYSAPLWWEANYSTGPFISTNAIAKQFQSTAGFDLSIVADYWPGVDKPKKPPLPDPLPKDDTMFTLRRIDDGFVELYVGNGKFVILTPEYNAALLSAGVPQYNLPHAIYGGVRDALVAAFN